MCYNKDKIDNMYNKVKNLIIVQSWGGSLIFKAKLGWKLWKCFSPFYVLIFWMG